MNRGTVMEAGHSKAVVLTPDGEFIQITVRGDVGVGEEISWADTDVLPGRRRTALPGRRWISAAISAAAVLLLMFGLWSFRTPPVVAYVSMDINPSVEFGLDSHERVRELRAVNDDALPLIEGVAYKGKSIESVMRVLAEKLTASRILNGSDGEIVIASVRLKSVDMNWEVQVTDKIERVLLQASVGTPDQSASPSLAVEKLYLPVEVREEAEVNGISSGKMAFWLAAENKGHEVPLSSLQEQSLKKIASSWGGLDEVLDESADPKEDKEKWKKLLDDKKEKKKQSAHKPSPSPSKGKPAETGKAGKPEDGKQKHDKQKRKNEQSPISKVKDKKDNDDKKKWKKDDGEKNGDDREYERERDNRHDDRRGNGRQDDRDDSKRENRHDSTTSRDQDKEGGRKSGDDR